MKKAKLIITTVDGLIAIAFGALFVTAVISVAKGAWWHIVSAVISGTICYMMLNEVKRLNED